MIVFKLPAGGNTITISNSVISLKEAIETAIGADYVFPFGSNALIVSGIDETVRMLFDGNDPSGTEGHQVFGSTLYTFKHIDLNKVKFIRDSSAVGDATLAITIAQSHDYEA